MQLNDSGTGMPTGGGGPSDTTNPISVPGAPTTPAETPVTTPEPMVPGSEVPGAPTGGMPEPTAPEPVTGGTPMGGVSDGTTNNPGGQQPGM